MGLSYQYGGYRDSSGLCRFSRIVLGSGGLYHISRTGTGTIVDCVVSIGMVMGQLYTVSCQ